MASVVEIASVPTVDTPGTCIVFQHDKRSYTFGRVAEGSQRAFGNRKISITRTEHIFLSGSIDWSQVGGLIGYILTVGNANEATKVARRQQNSDRQKRGKEPLEDNTTPIEIHGGHNLSHAIASTRAAIFRQTARVKVNEIRNDVRGATPENIEPDWQDDAVRVWTIPVQRARSSSPRKRRRLSPASETEATTETTAKVSRGQSPSASQLSDPVFSQMLIESFMFNGSQQAPTVIASRAGDLRPGEGALLQKGTSQAYGPYNGPRGEECSDAQESDQTVWVFPRPGEGKAETTGGRTIGAATLPLPSTTYSDTSMSYIIKCHDRRGKFDPVTAQSFGVKPINFKHLVAGKTVMGENGVEVTPDMVLGEQKSGHGIIVADIESQDFLDAFMDRPEWANNTLMGNIVMMYWILGPGLAQDPKIQQFVKKHSKIKHVLCAPEACPNMLSNPSAAQMQMKLRRLDADRFPLLQYDNTVQYPAPSSGSNIELGRIGKKVQIMPRIIANDDATAAFEDLVRASQEVDQDILELARAAELKSKSAEFLEEVRKEQQDIPNQDAEVVALGTGSSIPGKYRNVAGTLIRVPNVGTYLLDAGEGTLGQIKRLFSPDDVTDILRTLKCIVISHLHADHHMGVPSLIKAWYEQSLRDDSKSKLAISCVGRYRQFLNEVSLMEDFGYHRLVFPSFEMGDKSVEIVPAANLSSGIFGLSSIKRIPVSHCWRSYGTQLELTSGLRIAYSGDCRPSTLFAEECRGAHLLVHECTFDDDMVSHAIAKKHSTMAEALGVSRQMGARKTLLTHFSQRYIKTASLKQANDGSEVQNVLLAFDFMKVKLGDFRKAACFTPAIRLLMDRLGD